MEWNDLQFFNPFAEIVHTSNVLPHWQQPGATYFITFRLGDAIPATLREQWQHEKELWLEQNPKPWSLPVEMEYHQRFSRQADQWLDAGHGACLLRKTESRALVEGSLRHFDDDRHFHHAWVVMPNHVHCLTTLSPAFRLEQVLKSWKSYSAQRLNQRLGRTGSVWQEDYFDRLIRDAEHFTNCVRYIRNNPRKAGLKTGEFTHFETDFAKRR
ncbi:MAG: REP-associated tyrosine transposase [Prosthecobacter sp.]